MSDHRSKKRQLRVKAAGAALLILGTLLLLASRLIPQASDPSTTFHRATAQIIRVAQHGLLFGDRRFDESQLRFNAFIFPVFMDELSDSQRSLLTRAATLAGEALSPPGLGTFLLLVASWAFAGRALDQRYAEATGGDNLPNPVDPQPLLDLSGDDDTESS